MKNKISSAPSVSKSTRGFGWLPDRPDPRDILYAAPLFALHALPSSVDLRKRCPRIYDQGALGSCTANAIAGAFEFELMRQRARQVVTPSRLFIYYNERVIEGHPDEDTGAYIRDGFKTIAHDGVCPEAQWPYDIARFAQRPPVASYTAATRWQALRYARLTPSLAHLRGCLAEGFPFVFGFFVYTSFMGEAVAATGIVPMPQPGDQLEGGHAVMAVGYDDAAQRFTVRNSWGNGWGQKGYFTMPYDYLTTPKLADDFWTLRLVEEGG